MDYTVTHLTNLYGIITSVSADVIITDVPINTGTSKVFTGNLAGLSSQSPAVSVMQSFSVSFTSSDTSTSKADNVNGNVVKRYLPPALILAFVLPPPYPLVPPLVPTLSSLPYLSIYLSSIFPYKNDFKLLSTLLI